MSHTITDLNTTESLYILLNFGPQSLQTVNKTDVSLCKTVGSQKDDMFGSLTHKSLSFKCFDKGVIILLIMKHTKET